MVADIEQTMGYTGEAEAFLRVTCGDLCETAWFPISDKVSDQVVDKIISTINTQTADEIERLRWVEQQHERLKKAARELVEKLDSGSLSWWLRDIKAALEEK